jgi:anti-sigma B factor antagonist
MAPELIRVRSMSDAASPISITPTASGIAVAGEIDAHTAPAVAAALAASDHDPLVLDLAAVEFVDSSGLRVLLEAHQVLEAEGRSLVLSRPSTAVQRLLDVAGVEGYLVVADTTDL